MNDDMLKNMGIALEDQLIAELKDKMPRLITLLIVGLKSSEDIGLLFDCAKFTAITLIKIERELKELEDGK